jgi:RNA polymerase sigma-70 factor (ECF subfamily)
VPDSGLAHSESTPDLPGILSRAAAGDEHAWRRLIDLFSRRVFALAKSRCRNAEVAEEITQSVFATVASKLSLGEYTEQGRFESWIFRVTMNRLRDEMRRARRQASPTDPEGFATMAARPENDHQTPPELLRLRDALEQLPPADREIVELRHHGGLSFKQLAELLDEPLGTLLARHHRALKKLHAILTAGSDAEEHDEANP